MTPSQTTERQLAELEKAKFYQSIFDELKKKYIDLEILVDETLDAIRIEIIEEVRTTEKLSPQTLQNIKRATAILDTTGNVGGNNLLLKYLNLLEDALHPKWPKNFLDELLIDDRFQDYKKVVHVAIGMDKQRWDFIIQEGAKSSLYSRLETKIDSMDKLIKIFKKASKTKKEES